MKRLTKLIRRYKYLLFITLMLGTACTIFIAGVQFPTIVALIVLICAVSADFMSTYLCLRIGGREGNPVIAWLFKKLTVAGTFLLMAGIWSVFIVFRWLHTDVGSQTAIALTYWLVPINNAMVMRALIKKQYKEV